MKKLRLYDIHIYGLKPGTHEYEYEINDEFFTLREESPISEGKLKVTLRITKSETMLVFDFKTKGSVRLECDRSLEEFDFNIESNNRIVYKYGHTYEEVNDELFIIPQNYDTVNVYNHIYEIIAVLIPFKKLHPKYQKDEEGEFDTLIYSDEEYVSKEYEDGIEGSEETDGSLDAPVDPRFAVLLKLKSKE